MVVISIIRDGLSHSASYSFVNLLADWSITKITICWEEVMQMNSEEADRKLTQRQREQRPTLVPLQFLPQNNTLYCMYMHISFPPEWVSALSLFSPKFCQLSLYSFKYNTDLLNLSYKLINLSTD